jgi:rubrerythrin
MSLAEKMTDMPTFLAYSVALEEESAERHDELADMMDVHHNPDVAKTFRKLARYSRLHAGEIREHAAAQALPTIAPWDFEWDDMEGPETGDIADVDYLMSAPRALKIAMGNEQRAHDFYREIGEHSPDESVRELAAEFAAEELEHLELLQEWQDRIGDSADEFVFDPDPAHTPE